jgi:ribonuclease E
MLIDATQPEEIRVAVISGNRLEELDFETAARKQLKGNIYLAKVVRVEPSLQAAFVDYSGNRHGFLAFNEIHPDYYRIPVADREALIAEEEAFAKAERQADVLAEDEDEDLEQEEKSVGPNAGLDSEATSDENWANASNPDDVRVEADVGEAALEPAVETVGGEEIDEEAAKRRAPSRRYKIQEVIKRRQVMLVQVAKEERGTKGAALTTRLSLAGRYCVLMPNTGRGGGISRKITNPADRKRLRSIIESLNIPEGMSLIVRTAGSKRTKAEIRRDYEYLLRLWDDIRKLTLKSKAPAVIHEEANLIKRSIRDLYTRDMDEVLVEGEEGYRTAKAFVRTLMPSHAKRVQPYRDPMIPLFHRYQIESQIDAIHNPVVRLKSGGYIVLNQAEALVAVDVNSGRATRERNIEETATKTNLEAADEIARQLRLRDLAGLIVIDFIDMEISKNLRAVERRLKEAMKSDRARIQLGRISAFGLLELSRQRMRPSLFEISTERCPQCGGAGVIRSTESTALYVLRTIAEEGIRKRSAEVAVYVPTDVGLYILNQKRRMLNDIEQRYGFSVIVNSDDSLVPPDFRIETIKGERGAGAVRAAEAEEEEPPEIEPAGLEAPAAAEEAPEEEKAGRKRRRRGKRGGRRRSRKAPKTAAKGGEEQPAEIAAQSASQSDAARQAEPSAEVVERATTKPARPARRRRKAPPRDKKGKEEASKPAGDGGTEPGSGQRAPARARAKPARARRGRRRAAETPAVAAGEVEEKESLAPAAELGESEPAAAGELATGVEAPAAMTEDAAESSTRSKRKGWWQRLTD